VVKIDPYTRKEKASNRLRAMLKSDSQTKMGIEISSLQLLFLTDYGLNLKKILLQFQEAGQCYIKEGKVYGVFKKDDFIDKWARKEEND